MSESGGRVLAIDPGEVRVGLSISDSLRMTAQGLETFVRGRGSFLDHLETLIHDYAVDCIVLGYPLHMDGSAGESALKSESLRDLLVERFRLPVHLWDERLSSVEARKAFPPGSRKDWDQIAAALILQGYLDSIAGGSDEY